MRHILRAGLLALVVSISSIDDQVAAQSSSLPAQTVPAARRYAGFERLTLSSGSAAALASIPAKDGAQQVRYMVAFIEGGDVRFRLDGAGTLPTASVGVPIRDGGWMPFTIDADAMAQLRFIRTGSATVDVWVLYFW